MGSLRPFKRALENLPGLLDDRASPCDVLPVSSALHRLLSHEAPAESASTPPTFARHHSSPAELSSLPDACAQRQKGLITWSLVGYATAFVVLDAVKNLAVSWAVVHGPVRAPLVVVVKNLLSILCGMTLAGSLDGAHGLRECLTVSTAIKVSPIAGCFCGAQICALQALKGFDPGSLKVMSQVNLPVTMVLSALVLKRKYSGSQILAIFLLFVGTMAFLQVCTLYTAPPAGGRDLEIGTRFTPAFCFMLGIGLSCSASVAAEYFLRTKRQVPFYIQKTNLMFGELIVALIFASVTQRGDYGFRPWKAMQDFLWAVLAVRDWNGLLNVIYSLWPIIFTIVIAMVWSAHGWMCGLLVKRFSALTKNVCHIISAVVTYVLAEVLYQEGHKWPVNVAAVLVLLQVMVVATAPPYPSKKKPKGSTLRVAALASAAAATSPHLQQQQIQMLEGLPPGTLTPPLRLKRENSFVRSISVEAGSLGTPLLRVDSQDMLCSPRSGHKAKWNAWCLPLLLIGFVLLDALKPLLVSWAHQGKKADEHFIHSTFVLFQTSVSAILGLIWAVWPSRSESVHESGVRAVLHPQWRAKLGVCLYWRAVLERLPVSFCLCLSKLLIVMALQHVDAGTVRVFGQSSLPLVAVSAALFLNRKYSRQQWCSLGTLTVALVAFYYVKNEATEVNANQGSTIDPVGVLLILAGIGFNCLGALLVEKFLQHGHARLHVQKVQLLLGEVLVNLFICLVVPLITGDPVISPWKRGFFAGWDHRVFLCVVVWIPAGWSATMIVKQASSLLKTIAQAASSVLTYIWSVFPLTLVGPRLNPEPLSSPVILLALTVMLSALTFGTDSASLKPPNKREKKVIMDTGPFRRTKSTESMDHCDMIEREAFRPGDHKGSKVFDGRGVAADPTVQWVGNYRPPTSGASTPPLSGNLVGKAAGA